MSMATNDKKISNLITNKKIRKINETRFNLNLPQTETILRGDSEQKLLCQCTQCLNRFKMYPKYWFQLTEI